MLVGGWIQILSQLLVFEWTGRHAVVCPTSCLNGWDLEGLSIQAEQLGRPGSSASDQHVDTSE